MNMPSARKVMLTVFWDCQGVLLAHFQKRGENLNSASDCEVLLKLWDVISRKRPDQLATGVLLRHDNARPHTARATQERIQELQWELLEHPPYSPDLATSDFHLFGPLKNHLDGKSRLFYRFRRTVKAMGQVYQYWWRICREINVFSRFECHMFYVLYPFMTYILALPRN
jgi:hypothetical protein